MPSMGELQLRALREKGVNAALTIPKEKAIGWLDCWVISAGAKDLEANAVAGLTCADRLSWLHASESYEKRLCIEDRAT